MNIRYAVILSIVLLFVSACAQKVNDPADVQAVKDTAPAWDKAYNAGNAEAIASGYYAADAVRMEPSQPAVVGKDAIRTSLQKILRPVQ
jgi:ketosteroid isomerase-like protein